MSRVRCAAAARICARNGCCSGCVKPDAHVVSDARLAGRIDDTRGKLRHEDPRFEADTGLESDQAARLQELLQARRARRNPQRPPAASPALRASQAYLEGE